MSVYAPAADYLWELVQSFGQDPQPVFEAAGVDPELRFDASARLSRPQMNALHRAAYEATGDVGLGLRVVTDGGNRPGLARSALRNILRLVDGLPAFNIVGVVLILRSPERARFGDRVAGTRVVRAR